MKVINYISLSNIKLKQMKIKLSIISIIFLIFLPAAQSQVTIGSLQPPRKGTLLDLNEYETKSDKSNSGKGLGLPRVNLYSLNELGIDEETEKDKYIGTMVYNAYNFNGNTKEGIYYWTGSEWKQAIVIDNKGSEGSLLKSNGDGTYSWSNVTIPEYKFHKPTNIKGFNSDNAETFTYEYGKIVHRDIPNRYYVSEPDFTVFNGQYLYKEILNIQTDISTAKYLLLGATIYTKKAVSDGHFQTKTTWEAMQIDIMINPVGNPDKIVKSHRKVININAGGNSTGYIDYFTIIPLTGDNKIGKGDYEIKLKVINRENTFRYNLSSEGGNFDTKEPKFYTIGIEDANMVLFEYE